MTTSNKVFSLFSFLGFVLCCIPFTRHLQAWNTGTCIIMAWNSLACLMYFTNSIIWNDNVSNPAPVWCDISSRIGVAVAIGVPTGILCSNRRLYLIITGNAIVSQAERHRAVMLDLALGLGIPAIDIILMYIPQNGRFMIYEDFGCNFTTNNTAVGVVLAIVPQLLIGLVCAVYTILTIYLLYKRRVGLKEFLLSSSNISTGGYLRVLIVVIIGSACLVPLGLWLLICGLLNVSFWPGWTSTHADMSYVAIVPANIWRSDRILHSNLEITRWEFVFSATIFFACFGLHEEARASYRSALQHLIVRFRCIRHTRPSGDRETGLAPTGLPPLVFASSSTPPKKFLGFSTNLTKVFADIDGDLSRTQSSFPYTASWGGMTLSREDRPPADQEAEQPTSGPESQPVAVTPLTTVTRLERELSPSRPSAPA